MIRPTYRFGYVEENLCRGGIIKEENLNFMELLDLKSILNLNELSEKVDLTSKLKNVQTFKAKLEKQNQENIKIQSQKMNQIMMLMIDSNNHPMYINCLDGFVTNLVVACLRKLQGYEMGTIMEEATRFSKEEVLSQEEKDYITSYIGEMEISFELVQRLPKWYIVIVYENRLWNGKQLQKKHPTLRIKFQEMPPALQTAPAEEKEEVKSVSHSNLVRIPSLKISSLARNSITEVDETRLSRTIVALDLEFPADDSSGV